MTKDEALEKIMALLCDASVGKMHQDGTINPGETTETEEFIALVTLGWIFNRAHVIKSQIDE